jgi:hypothetical protein
MTNAKKNRTASGMSAPNRKSITPPCAHGDGVVGRIRIVNADGNICRREY